jgi:formylglycine-generating enzyme required for sulfatase activity
MGKPSKGRFSGTNLPVENISWQEAEQFCRKLSKRTGHDYHLPSEAQWEYACRAGTSSPFNTGDTITTDYANYCGDHTYRDETRGVYRHGTTPVEQFPANPFGICDLHGNLWEFCSDRWHADYVGAPFDGTPWEWGGEAGYRIARGGSWHEPPGNCRSATRLRVSEKERDDFYGFRLALSLPTPDRIKPAA